MADYERTRMINAPADDVFAFVTDMNNLSAFVPTVNSAQREADHRVRVKGEISGDRFEDDGWFHVDQDHHRLEWGADEDTYRGWLTVRTVDTGAQVVAHLSMPPWVSPSGAPVTGEASDGNAIEESLEASLDSLRNLMEGTGGKVAPATR
jgi:uncharacterized protein YndB with AHSA1/START domain